MTGLKSEVTAAAFGVIALGFLTSAQAADPLRVTIEKTNGESIPAYLEKASERAILWRYTPETPTGNTMAREEIKRIDFEPPDEWQQAEQFYKGGAYAEAAEAFGKIAGTYKDIMLLPGNPASMARYRQIESYRALGDFAKVSETLNDETFALLKTSIDAQFSAQLALNQAWAAAVKSNWDVVNQLIAEKSLPKAAGSNRTPEFRKELPPRELTQLAYLRGLSLDAAGDKEAALGEYYRTFTLGYGNDRDLSGKAALKALAILTADEELENKEGKLKEVRALARIYRFTYGAGKIPAEYLAYAEYVAPEEEDAEAAPAAPEPAAAEGDASSTPDPKKGEEKKADEKKADEKKAEGGAKAGAK